MYHRVVQYIRTLVYYDAVKDAATANENSNTVHSETPSNSKDSVLNSRNGSGGSGDKGGSDGNDNRKKNRPNSRINLTLILSRDDLIALIHYLEGIYA